MNQTTALWNFAADPQIAGPDFFDFAIPSPVPDGSCTKNTVVQLLSSCSITVVFTPDKPCQPFAEVGTLTLVDDAAGGQQAISLSGGAPFSAVLPNPITPTGTPQPIQIVGTGIQSGAAVRVADLRPQKIYVEATLGNVTSDSATANLSFGVPSQPATWAITVINPDGTNPSPRPGDPNNEKAIKAANPALMTNPITSRWWDRALRRFRSMRTIIHSKMERAALPT